MTILERIAQLVRRPVADTADTPPTAPAFHHEDRLPVFAAHVVRELDAQPHAGAQKRAWAFTVIKGKIPTAPDHLINLAIEEAVRDLKKAGTRE